MITEIVTFQLNDDASLADISSTASQVIRKSLVPELAAHGAHHAYYGQSIEKPVTGIIFVEWVSIEDHRIKSNYDTYVDNLRTIAKDEKAVTVLHVPFTPANPTPALGGNSKVGATEVVFFYFPSTLTASDKDFNMSCVDKMRPVMERSEALGVYDGWAMEEAVPKPGPQASEGETSKVYVNVVGWVDVKAHMRFQGSEDFQQNIHHFMGMKDMRHSQMVHIKFHAV